LCPGRSHHPAIDVDAVDVATRQRTAVFVDAGDVARPPTIMRKFNKLVARSDPASPFLAFGIKTELVCFGRVHAVQTNLGGANLNGIAINDAPNADDISG